MKNLTIFILLTVAYGLLGKACLLLAVPPGYSAPIWIPIGLMVASLFSISLEIVFPATLLGAFFVNFTLTHKLHPSLWDGIAMSGLIAFGSVGCVGIAWPLMRLLKKWLDNPVPNEPKILFLIAVLAPVASAFSALCGSISLFYFGMFERDYFLTNWAHWWVGDSIGILLILPLGYVLLYRKERINLVKGIWLFSPVIVILTALVLTFTYTNKTEVGYLQDAFAKNTDHLAREVEDNLKLDTEMMNSLVSFYEGSALVEEHEFHEFLFGSFKSHRNMEQVIWIPSLESPLYRNFYSHSDGDPRFDPLFIKDKIWRKVKDMRTPIIGPQIQNMQLLVFPVSKKNILLGMLVGVINTEKMITTAAQRTEMHSFEIELIDQNTKMSNVWKNGTLSQVEKVTRDGIIRHSYDFQILDHAWTIDVTTTRSQLFSSVPTSTLILLFFGLVFSYLASSLQLLLHFRSGNAEKDAA